MAIPEIEQLVEEIALTLNRALSVEDLDGTLLAYSSNQHDADKVRVEFLLAKKVPAQVKTWQLSQGIARSVRPVVVPANERLGMRGRICVPLLVRGYRVGYLWIQLGVEESSPMAVLAQLPGARPRIDVLADLVLDATTAVSDHRSGRETDFLAACGGDDDAAARLLSWREFHRTGPWQLVCAVNRATEDVQDASAAILLHRVAALQATLGLEPVLFTAGTESHAVMVFRASPGRVHHATAQVQYQLELSKRLGLHEATEAQRAVIFGMSEQAAEVSDIVQAYSQARLAAQAGYVDPQLGDLVEYAHCGVYPLLATQPQAELSVPYRKLKEADSNEELLPVLELLYDSEGSPAQVAQELHLHRSTVYNRLGRIRRIVGADPMHSQLRLQLHAAIKADRWALRPHLL